MKRDSLASDSLRLVYSEKARAIIGIPLLALGLFLIGGTLNHYFTAWLHDEPLLGNSSLPAHLFWLFIVVFTLGFGWDRSTSRRLVCDKALGQVTLSTSFFSWAFSTDYALEVFDGIVLTSQPSGGGEGSVSTSYSVDLVGPRKKVNILSTGDESYARQCAREFAEFLEVEKGVVEKGQLSARSGVIVLRIFFMFWCLLGSGILIFAIYLLAQISLDAISGRIEVEAGAVAFAVLFVVAVAGMVAFGVVHLRWALRNLEVAAVQERAVKTAEQSSAESTRSNSVANTANRQAPETLSRPKVVRKRISQLTKRLARVIPFLLFFYFAWDMFQDHEPPGAAQTSRERRRAMMIRKWEEAIRAQEKRLLSLESETVRFDVTLRGRSGPEIKGQIDTTHNTFVIHSWFDSRNSAWTPLPEALPITLYAFDTENELYDVPDDWNGALKGWAFLLPPDEDVTTISWSEGKPSRYWEGASFGWGGSRNASGTGIHSRGAKQFLYVPCKETAVTDFRLDEVTVKRHASKVNYK